jgi:hypothetical protein
MLREILDAHHPFAWLIVGIHLFGEANPAEDQRLSSED